MGRMFPFSWSNSRLSLFNSTILAAASQLSRQQCQHPSLLSLSHVCIFFPQWKPCTYPHPSKLTPNQWWIRSSLIGLFGPTIYQQFKNLSNCLALISSFDKSFLRYQAIRVSPSASWARIRSSSPLYCLDQALIQGLQPEYTQGTSARRHSGVFCQHVRHGLRSLGANWRYAKNLVIVFMVVENRAS